jgi:hypothetical protein
LCPRQKLDGCLFRGSISRTLLLEGEQRLEVEGDYFKTILVREFIHEGAEAILGQQQLPVIAHRTRDIEKEDVIGAGVGLFEVLTCGESETEVPVFVRTR